MKKVIGDMSVESNVIINGNNAIRSINSSKANQNGNVTVEQGGSDYNNKVVEMIPITRVGTMDYFPLNINGSFEGASTIEGLIMPNIIESNGSYVYLRPGTNGSTEGWYYSIVDNFKNSTVNANVNTNSKFSAGTITSDIDFFVGSKGSEALMMKAKNGKYILGLTNGTFDFNAHQYVELSGASFGTSMPQYVHIVGFRIFIWCLDEIDDNKPVAISLYTVLVDDVRNGLTSTVRKETAFFGKTIYNDTIISSPNILISPTLVSDNMSTKPLFFRGQDVVAISSFMNKSNAYIIAQASPDGTKVRVALYCSYRVFVLGVANSSVSFGLSMEVDHSTMAFTHDFSPSGAIKASYINGEIVDENPYSVSTINITGSGDGTLGNFGNIYQTEDGMVFSNIARTVSTPEYSMYRNKISNFTNLYNSLNLQTRRMTDKISRIISPTFGSALGENLIHPRICATDKIVLACSSTLDGKPKNYSSLSTTKFSGIPNYTYTSTSGNNISGFAPSSEREVVGNPNNQYTCPISIVNQDNTVRMYGTSFIEGMTKLSGGVIEPNSMSFSDSYTIQGQPTFDTIKNKMIATTDFTDVIESKLVLYYVPENTYSSSFAVCTVRLENPRGGINAWRILCEVDVVLNGNEVTDANILSTFSDPIVGDSFTILSDNISRQGGVTIAKYTDFTFVSIYTGFAPRNHIDMYFTATIAKIDNVSKRITSSKIFQSNYLSHVSGSYGAGVIPGLGFGLFKHGPITDDQTKLIFRNYGNTSSQMDKILSNLEAAPISEIVVASQDVPRGFNIYFTQEIPVLLGGKYYTLQPQTINLTNLFANVENKTFYLYIEQSGSVMNYKISSSILSEELYRVYIGSITTDSSRISNIVTEKVTRFLTYRVSTTKRGSAIPCSTGIPSSPGTRWK